MPCTNRRRSANEEEKMTRKDFELIANTIKNLDLSLREREMVAEKFATALAGTNAGFKPELFIARSLGER